MQKEVRLFERILSVGSEEMLPPLQSLASAEWLDFWLNPRRLRGSDFLMRWSQGVWSENRMVQAIHQTGEYFAIPYGPSGVAPDDDIREAELYFERLEAAGLGQQKRPDLLVFEASARQEIHALLNDIGGWAELPFLAENETIIQSILGQAILAIECENSLWVGKQMPDYGAPLTPQRRLGGKPGLKKNAVLPTIILKEEDIQPLLTWQASHGIPIHIWHVFYDLAFGIALNEALRLIQEGLILPTEQVFQAPGGAVTQKSIYKIYHHYAYLVGEAIQEPELVAKYIQDKNGHILPYVHFEGGRMELMTDALNVLKTMRHDKS
ncbi:MAG: AccI family restriction endonuclease [Saprospiraceae bacterium]|nr:AccI family restriction endonuclease [Saprospiraceae bacterium]MDW8228266.1 AccI family restriction endonuclease [Saprospiraceae bacterium]